VFRPSRDEWRQRTRSATWESCPDLALAAGVLLGLRFVRNRLRVKAFDVSRADVFLTVDHSLQGTFDFVGCARLAEVAITRQTKPPISRQTKPPISRGLERPIVTPDNGKRGAGSLCLFGGGGASLGPLDTPNHVG